MGRRGQVTMFVIIGIAMVIATAMVLYVIEVGNLEIDYDELSSVEGEVRYAVHKCLVQTSEMAVLSVARKGGYDVLPELRYMGNGFQTSYAYVHGTSWLRPMLLIEDAISEETSRLMPGCLQDLEGIKERGINVTLGAPAASTTIAGDNVIVTYEQPIKVQKGLMTVSVEGIRHVIPARLFAMRNAAEMIVFSTMIDPRSIDQEFLLTLGESQNLTIDVLYTDLGDVVYLVQDHERLLLDGAPLVFMFATKTDLSEEPPVFIMPETEYEATVGKEIVILVLVTDANGDPLSFDTNSTSVMPDRNGIIKYTPSKVGLEHVKITVTDGLFITSKTIAITTKEASP